MSSTVNIDEMNSVSSVVTAAMQNANRAVGDLNDGLGSLGQRFREVASTGSELFDTGPVSTFGRAIRNVTNDFKAFGRAVQQASVFQTGFVGGILGLIAGVKSAKIVFTGFGGLLKMIFTTATGLASAFVKSIGAVFSFFYGQLINSGGGGNELMERLNEMRREFGGLEDYTNQMIFGVADNLRMLPRRLEVVGWTLAQLLENAMKYAKTLGPLFADFFRYEFTPATHLFLQGMGATEEATVAMVRSARAMGQNLNTVLESVARNGAAVAAAIGVSRKVIQREMLEARKNIQLFGSVTDEELAVAVGRFQSLGIEAEKAAGALAKFDTFQGAAEAAGQLAAAFGMQIDVFKIVSEENPAAKLDLLRQSMFRTGRSAEQLSRRELMLFANVLGESDLNLVQLALSAQNAGMSMEQIGKAAEESGEKTKPMEQVLSDLSNQIARLIGSGGGYNTFLEAMNWGVTEGIQRWMRLERITVSYRMALHATAYGFRRMTVEFLRSFPGIQQIANGLVELFNPRHFRAFFRLFAGEVMPDGTITGTGLIHRFLRGENFNPRGFFESAMAGINRFFGPRGEATIKIIEGLKTVGTKILEVAKVALTMFSEKLFGDPENGIAGRMVKGFRDALRWLVGFFTPGNIENQLRQAGDFTGGFFEGFMNPIIEFFKSPAMKQVFSEILDLLGEAAIRVIELADRLFQRITGAIFNKFANGMFVDAEGLGPSMMETFMTLLIGPTVLGAALGLGTKLAVSLISGVTGGIARIGSSAISGALGNTIGAAATSGSGGGIMGVVSRIFSRRGAGAAASDGLEILETNMDARSSAVEGATRGSEGVASSVANMGKINAGQIIKGLAVLTLAVGIIGGIGYFLVRALNKLPISDPIELAVKAGAFAAVVLSMAPMTLAVAAIGLAASPAMIIPGAATVAVMSVFLGGTGYVLVRLLNSIDIKDGLAEKALAFGVVLNSMLLPIIAAAAIGALASTGIGAVVIIAGAALLTAFAATMGSGVIHMLGVLSNIDITSNQARALEALPGFFNSAGIMMSSIKDVARFFRRGDAVNITSAMNVLTEVMTLVFNKTKEIVGVISSSVASITSSGGLEQVARGTEVFTNIFDSIVSLIPAVGSLIEAGEVPWYRSQTRKTELVTAAFTGLNSMFAGLFGTDSIVNQLVASIRGISVSSSDVEKLEVLGPIFTSIIEISKVASEYGGKLVEIPATLTGNTQVAAIGTSVTGFITGIMNLVTTGVPDAIKALIGALGGVSIPEGAGDMLSSVTGLLSSVFALVGSMGEMFQSERSRAAMALIENNSDITRRTRQVVESLSSEAPAISVIATSIGTILEKLKEPISALINIVVSKASEIQNAEEFAAKSQAILSVITSVGNVVDLGKKLSDLMKDQNFVINSSQIGDLSKTRMSEMLGVIGSVIEDFATRQELTKIPTANSKLDQINNEFMPRLQRFFEESGEVISAIKSSGVVELTRELRNVSLEQLLPAAVAATETTAATITDRGITIDAMGMTFNISVVLEVDGEKLAVVAAERLNSLRSSAAR